MATSEPTPDQVSEYAEWLETSQDIAKALERTLGSMLTKSASVQVTLLDLRPVDQGVHFDVYARAIWDGGVHKLVPEEELMEAAQTKVTYLAYCGIIAEELRPKLWPGGKPPSTDWYEATGQRIARTKVGATMNYDLNRAKDALEKMVTQMEATRAAVAKLPSPSTTPPYSKPDDATGAQDTNEDTAD